MCDFMTRLGRLSSAEDFLSFLSIPFDQRVVNVNRLHIMKRFGTTLAALDLATRDDASAMADVRAALASAYGEFETSDGRSARLFKVFATAPVSMPPAGTGCSGSCGSACPAGTPAQPPLGN